MKIGMVKTVQANIITGQMRIMRMHQSDGVLHRHEFFELVYILKGTATHILEENATLLQAGDYFIIDPGTKHCYRDTKDLELINCLFLPEYIDRALKDCPSLSSLLSNQMLRFGVPVDIHAADKIFRDRDGSVGKLIRQMEQEYAARNVGYMELLRCNLTHILVYAVRAYEHADLARVQHSATASIVGYLQMHYTQVLSLQKISQQFGYSPQYLSALFHRDMGMTLQTYLQRLRVEEACRLMQSAKISTATLAQAVGYNDAKYFCKVFRQQKGMSLKEYRTENCCD